MSLWEGPTSQLWQNKSEQIHKGGRIRTALRNGLQSRYRSLASNSHEGNRYIGYRLMPVQWIRFRFTLLTFVEPVVAARCRHVPGLVPERRWKKSAWHAMTSATQGSLYDALLVNQDATLDEIKLAFKRRALQVHPDKGGSKEAFHLVYEALETLADPEARKKYDHSLAARKSGKIAKPGGPGLKRKRSHPSPKEGPQKPKPPKWGKKSKADDGRAGSEPAGPARPQVPESKETKLLIKIRDLLKSLPRDVRSDVFTMQFSQKQRLILEKWMVDNSAGVQCGRDTRVAALATQSSACGAAFHPGSADAGTGEMIPNTKESANDESSRALVLHSQGKSSSFAAGVPSTLDSAKPKSSRIRPNSPTALQLKTKSSRNKQRKDQKQKSSHSGCVFKLRDSYRASIKFDAIGIQTGLFDFETALEYLVILTFVKQKVQDGTGMPANFEDRLQTALGLSAKEHGREVAEMRLVFSVQLRVGVLVGPQYTLKSPCVRSIDTFKKMRTFLDPFRVYSSRNLKGARIYWQYSPVHLQEAWERFQKAVADAWEVAGKDCTNTTQKFCAHHEATATSRLRNLQSWERQRMAKQDKNRWNKHLPPRLKDQNALSRKLLLLNKLLEMWERLLRNLEDKQRRKALRLRSLQRKKEREEQKRSEILSRKRMREEERSRRDNIRQRMKSSEFMDDLPWIWRCSLRETADCQTGKIWWYMNHESSGISFSVWHALRSKTCDQIQKHTKTLHGSQRHMISYDSCLRMCDVLEFKVQRCFWHSKSSFMLEPSALLSRTLCWLGVKQFHRFGWCWVVTCLKHKTLVVPA